MVIELHRQSMLILVARTFQSLQYPQIAVMTVMQAAFSRESSSHVSRNHGRKKPFFRWWRRSSPASSSALKSRGRLETSRIRPYGSISVTWLWDRRVGRKQNYRTWWFGSTQLLVHPPRCEKPGPCAECYCVRRRYTETPIYASNQLAKSMGASTGGRPISPKYPVQSIDFTLPTRRAASKRQEWLVGPPDWMSIRQLFRQDVTHVIILLMDVRLHCRCSATWSICPMTALSSAVSDSKSGSAFLEESRDAWGPVAWSP